MELAGFLCLLVRAQAVLLTCHRRQCHVRQRLASCHAALHVRRRRGGAGGGGNCEATRLDEERGLLGFYQGVLQEGNRIVEGANQMSNPGQCRVSFQTGDGGVGAGLEKETGFGAPVSAALQT